MIKPSKRQAYTVIEILVAALIFGVFSVCVFQIYRMGSNMFISGKWKLGKQKESERFLSFLKERIEQTSQPIIVSGRQLDSSAFATNFGVDVGTYTFANVTAPRTIMAFAVCKPSILGANDLPVNAQSAGLVLYHLLRVVPCSTFKAKNLINLEMLATTDLDGSQATPFSPGSCNFWPGGTPPDTTKFTGTPNLYMLGNDNYQTVLTEIATLTIQYSPPTEVASSTSNAIIKIKADCVCPGHTQTMLSSMISASIGSVLNGVAITNIAGNSI